MTILCILRTSLVICRQGMYLSIYKCVSHQRSLPKTHTCFRFLRSVDRQCLCDLSLGGRSSARVRVGRRMHEC